MKKVRHIHLAAFTAFGAILVLGIMPVSENKGEGYDTRSFAEIHSSWLLLDPVPADLIFPTTYFCSGCHGYDPLMQSMVDSMGNDVNVFDDWRSSMMANSAKDPFWRAKVSHEILANPAHSLDLQTKCTSCHAPQGHYTAILRGAQHYTMAEMLLDSVALQGVSCGACHSISNVNLGKSFSGQIHYDTNRVVYGPYEMPFAAPMTEFVGIKPLYSPHVNDAGLCASCHTLITNSVDLNGNYTGAQFVEQATYHEWLNSAYNTGGDTPQTCQSCHMPRIEDKVVISSSYAFLKGRTPFGQHTLVGGNTTMLKLMKANKETLEIDAEDEHFDETIAKTFELLQQKSLDLDLELDQVTPDSAYFTVVLKNKAGHKFPSGYPSRRAFIEFIATGENGDTLFHSGALQPDYEVAGQGPETMPHFNVIHREDQVQIYELVLGDINGNFTTLLERSHQALKDNRLPPVGFKTSHPAYDTTRIYGGALEDPDFNFENGKEGSGADMVHYHVPLGGYSGFLNITAKVYYQAMPPKWMAPMFAEYSPQIMAFKTMYDAADLSPVLVASDTLGGILIEPSAVVNPVITGLEVYPTAVKKGQPVYFSRSAGIRIAGLKVYDVSGNLIMEKKGDLSEVILPGSGSRVYILEIFTNKGRVLKKIVGNL